MLKLTENKIKNQGNHKNPKKWNQDQDLQAVRGQDLNHKEKEKEEDKMKEKSQGKKTEIVIIKEKKKKTPIKNK